MVWFLAGWLKVTLNIGAKVLFWKKTKQNYLFAPFDIF